MLRFLSIRHLAVIDRLELELGSGLTVLTGETGAGKSILVGAVGLLVGGRASADLVRTGEETAAIEAIFDTPEGKELIVRREISAQGRSRAFVDGALATSTSLRDLSRTLVDLHGQHEHQMLLDPSSHLDVLDAYAAADADRGAVAEAFAAWRALHEQKERRTANQREQAVRAEFLAFQLAEIDRVAPKASEDEELAATRQVLANADKLQRLCEEAYQSLYEGDTAALPALGGVWRRVGELAAIDERFSPYVAARDPIKSSLEDLAFFLRSYVAGIEASPAKLQEIEDRLAALERLKKKHGPTLAEVIEKAASLQRELDDVAHGTERAAELDAALAAARDTYLATAGALSHKRRTAAPVFCRTLERSLADLAMNRTRCEVRFADAESESHWSERGIEQAEFYISPNPGEDLRPLARIASGGELSRLMLALKTLGSTDAAGKTLIFDEVDTGIGGAVADVVGLRLQALARKFQVLCITHLPQIAAYGSAHLSISKSVKQGRTLTRVDRLSDTDRHEELARMIGGSDVSAAVRASAREMLAARSQGQHGPQGARARAKGEQKAKDESENAPR
jgi:DNA repair protein RecN (Recombination protein N)